MRLDCIYGFYKNRAIMLAPMKVSICISLFFGLFALSSSFGAVWSSGHGDIGIGFDGTEWEPHFHFHEEEEEHEEEEGHEDGEEHEDHAIIDGAEPAREEYGIGELTIRVRGPAQPGAGITNSGALSVYLLAQDESLASSLGSPFVGWAVEEISEGIFQNDLVTMSLVSVSGPGVFSLWNTDAFGADSVLMSSALGSEAPGQVGLALDPGHYHFNIGFSEAGVYDVTYRSEGELAAGGITGSDFTVRYNVVPEPSSLVLLFVGAAATLRRKRA